MEFPFCTCVPQVPSICMEGDGEMASVCDLDDVSSDGAHDYVAKI